MLRCILPAIPLFIPLAQAADPLETIHTGSYSQSSPDGATARVLNWNIDRGKHHEGILSAIRDTKPDL